MFIVQKLIARKNLARKLTRQENSDEKNSKFGNRRSKSLNRRISYERSTTSTTSATEPHSLLDVLTKEEQRAIKVTWTHMKGKVGLRKADSLMVSVFERVSTKQPICKVFVKATLLKSSKSTRICSVYEHGKMLSRLFDQMICPEEYNRLKKEETGLFTIGQIHRNLNKAGLTADMWESFGICLSDIISSQDAVRAFPRAPRAWNLLIATLTDRARYDFEQQSRTISLKGHVKCKSVTSNNIKCETVMIKKKLSRTNSNPTKSTSDLRPAETTNEQPCAYVKQEVSAPERKKEKIENFKNRSPGHRSLLHVTPVHTPCLTRNKTFNSTYCISDIIPANYEAGGSPIPVRSQNLSIYRQWEVFDLL